MNDLNNDIELEFELCDEEAQLSGRQPLSPDRSVVTVQKIGDTVVKAAIDRVQYGTYEGASACFVLFAFEFGFNGNTHGRFKSALVQVSTSRIISPPQPEEERYKIHIAQLAPVEVWGIPKPLGIEDTKSINMSLGGKAPGGGPELAITPSIQRLSTRTPDKYRSIYGQRYSANDADEENIALWKLKENKVQKDGIFPRFQGVIIILLPKDGTGVQAVVDVSPKVAFSLNPLKYFKLRQRRHDPIRFDGKTTKGQPVDQGIDFADKDHHWTQLLELPTEYKDRILVD